MKKKKKLSIKKAIKRPGALTRKAKAHGMTVDQFARGVVSGRIKASPLTKDQAEFYVYKLKPLAKKRKKKASKS